MIINNIKSLEEKDNVISIDKNIFDEKENILLKLKHVKTKIIIGDIKTKIVMCKISFNKIFRLIITTNYLSENIQTKINELYYFHFSDMPVEIILESFSKIELHYLKFKVDQLIINLHSIYCFRFYNSINSLSNIISNIIIRDAYGYRVNFDERNFILPILPNITKIFYNDLVIKSFDVDILTEMRDNPVVSDFIKNNIKIIDTKKIKILKSEFENDFDEEMFLRIKDYLL